MPQSAPEQSKPRPCAGHMMQGLCHDPTANQELDLTARHGRMALRKRT